MYALKRCNEKASVLTALSIRATGGGARWVDLSMQRQDLADCFGLTIETVSRTFTRFKCLGLINFSRRVPILGPDALARLAAADHDAAPIDPCRSRQETGSVR